MNAIEILILNFEENRRRSIKLWNGIPVEYLNWRPDKDAMSVFEMIRHVLETEHLFHIIVERQGNLGDYKSPWKSREYINIEDEVAFASQYRKAFFEKVRSFSERDLETIIIDRTEVGQRRKLGDYLLRIALHESVHMGQMLGYLRTLWIERPLIWD